MIIADDAEVNITRINEQLISDVERLFKILGKNEFIEPETKDEINKTIQWYMKEIREFRTMLGESREPYAMKFEDLSQEEQRKFKEKLKKWGN